MTRKRVLTKAQRIAVRAEYKPNVRGYGYESLAAKWRVGASTIRDLVTGRVTP